MSVFSEFTSMHLSSRYWANQPTNHFNNMRYLVFALHSSNWADMPASPWTITDNGKNTCPTCIQSFLYHFCLVRCKGHYQHNISTYINICNKKSGSARWFRTKKNRTHHQHHHHHHHRHHHHRHRHHHHLRHPHSAQQRNHPGVLLPVFLQPSTIEARNSRKRGSPIKTNG